MSKPHNAPHLDAIRAQILPLVLSEATFDGWSESVLQRAAEQLKLHPGQIELALPNGMIDLIRYWAAQNDARMLCAWDEADTDAMRIRDRAIFLVKARILAIGDEHQEASRRAVGRLSLPDGAVAAAELTWATSDAMWRAMNDTSTDYNFYTKRGILSAVFAATLSVWHQGKDETTWAFLDRRIENIMQFEGFKAKMRKQCADWPNPIQTLAKLRYGRGRARARRM